MPSKTILVFAIFLTILKIISSVKSAKLEPFHSYDHGVKSGPVNLTDTQITIPDFHYDGTGPEPYFMVGDCSDKFRQERPNPPLRGTKLADENGSTKKLKKYTGQTITLTLPAGKTWKDYHYIAVYCVPYNHNFGYVEIKHEVLYPNDCPLTNSTTTEEDPSYCRPCPASARSIWEYRSVISQVFLASTVIFARWSLVA